MSAYKGVCSACLLEVRDFASAVKYSPSHLDPIEFYHRDCWDTATPPRADPVNTPEHYRWLPVEAIEITELFNFNMGNALKYIIRADHKGKPLEDLAKAKWYVERELKRRETTPPS